MSLISKRIEKLIPYTAGEQLEFIIKLNTNENPYPPTPKIKDVLESIEIEKLRLYPDQNSVMLRQALAQKYDVDIDMVFVGNGSDEILAFVNMAFFDDSNEKMAYPDITYSFYPVYNELFKIDNIILPVKEDYSVDLDEYSNLDVKGYIFANPNAPTGKALRVEDIETFIRLNQDKLIVIDEAYIDFCDESVVSLTNKYDNLLVIQTFSKGYALAGIRCGYAIGNKKLIDGLKIIKNSFNNYPVDYITELIATEAVKDTEYYRELSKKICTTRENITQKLKELGFRVVESASNFLFVSHDKAPAEKLYLALKKEKILVRHWNKPRIENNLRISIGTDEQMNYFIKVLSKILNDV